jgi:hypothetical protein
MQEARIRVKIDTKAAQDELKNLGKDVDEIEKDARSRVGKKKKKAAGVVGAPAARGGRLGGAGRALGTAVTIRGGILLAGEAANAVTALTPVVKGIIEGTFKGALNPVGEAINSIVGIPANVINFTKSEAGGRIAGAMQGLGAVKALAELGEGANQEQLGAIGGMFRDTAVAQSGFDRMIEDQKKTRMWSKYETKNVLEVMIGDQGLQSLKQTIIEEVLKVVNGSMGLLPGK